MVVARGPAQLLAADPGLALLVLTAMVLAGLWFLALAGPRQLFGSFSRGALVLFTFLHFAAAAPRLMAGRGANTNTGARGRSVRAGVLR